MATDRAVNEHEAADRLALSVTTLRAWRHRHQGPRFVRFGRAVRYLVADIDAFIAESRVDTHSTSSATVVPDEETGRAA